MSFHGNGTVVTRKGHVLSRIVCCPYTEICCPYTEIFMSFYGSFKHVISTIYVKIYIFLRTYVSKYIYILNTYYYKADFHVLTRKWGEYETR